MARLFLLFNIILLGVSHSYSQVESISDNPLLEKTLLWKVTGNEIKDASYIFGTMHLMQEEHFLFPKKLEKLLKKSDMLVMELAELPSPDEAMTYIMLDEGSMFDIFTTEQTDSILDWAKAEFNMDEGTFKMVFSRMKPFALVQLSVQINFIGETKSYELEFEKIAINNNISIKGLETVAKQMALFDKLSDEQQVAMVMESIRDSQAAIELVKTMQTLYLKQDVDALYALILDEGGILGEEENRFLGERNVNWSDQLKKLFSENRLFIAVGAGHLGGQEGLIRLLINEGFTVTPVKL